MTLREFVAEAQRILEADGGRHADNSVVLHTCNPAMGNHNSVPIMKLHVGFDWSSGQIILGTGDIDILALPSHGKPGRKFEDAEVIAAQEKPQLPTLVTLKHRGGYVGDHLRTQLSPGDRIRIIKLSPPTKPAKQP